MKPAGQELPTGTVTFLAVDIAYRFYAAARYDRWLSSCRLVRAPIDSAVSAHGGVIVPGRGNDHQFVYAFSRPTRALSAALQIHQRHATGPEAGFEQPDLRSAILTGEVEVQNGCYVGVALDQVIGLKNLAHPHQILISLSTVELVRTLAEESIGFRDLGNHRLSETARPERVFQVEGPGLPAEFPGLRSLDSALTNLQAAANPFVGRDRELYEIGRQMRASRLLTLTGCGGIGKSRLASELGHLLLHQFADGVFLVDFGALTNGAFIQETIATELPFIHAAGPELQQRLKDAFKRRQLLLILDNCDHVAEALADEIEQLFPDTHACEILLTSREPLGYKSELVCPLPPLDVEPGVDSPEELSNAGRLLLQRMNDAVPGYREKPVDRSQVQELCRALRGIPIALELAAAKFKVMPLKSIKEQVEAAIEASAGGSSLQAVVDVALEWALASLSAKEAQVLYKLSAFTGGWENEAAQEVCQSKEVSAAEVGRQIDMLVQRSLVGRSYRGPHVRRDHLSQSIWEFAYQRLVERGEDAPCRDRHKQWYVQIAEWASKELSGPDQHRAIERLDRDKHNIRAAVEWCLNGGQDLSAAFAIATGVYLFWYKRGYFTEARIWLERILEYSDGTSEASEDRTRALNILGIFLGDGGDPEQAIKFLNHGLALANKLDSRELRASLTANLGKNYRVLGDVAGAIQAFEASVSEFEEMGDDAKLCLALTNLGTTYSWSGELEAAEPPLRRALDLAVTLKNEWIVIMLQYNMAELALRQDAVERAQPLYASSLARWYEQKDYRGVALVLRSMANMADRLGQLDRAAVLLGASSSLRGRLQEDLAAADKEDHAKLVGRLTNGLGDAAFFKRWTEGNNLSTDAAVQYALGKA